MTEVIPVSKALSEVAHVGLTCIRTLHASESISREEREAYIAVLELASEPIVEVTLAVIPDIRTLLESVPGDPENEQSICRKEMS